MKQFILIGVLTGLLAAINPLGAQVAPRDSGARKGSRLELGRTASPTRRLNVSGLPGQRFTLTNKPAAPGLDRSMTSYKNAAINDHYKTLLLAGSANRATTRPAGSDATPNATNDVRPTPAQEGRSENRMYTNDKLWVTNAYPNPADEAVELDYQFVGPVNEAKVVLLNVLGAPVAEYELERGDRKIRIPTRDLATGYYLYQLSVEGKKVATKRLLVRHQ